MANEKRLIDANELWAEAMNYADTSIEFDGEGMANFIANAPTVDAVEVVHGRWILTNGEDGLYYDCSICGHCAGRGRKSNYCPNCGAKMDGGNEDA